MDASANMVGEELVQSDDHGVLVDRVDEWMNGRDVQMIVVVEGVGVISRVVRLA